MKTASTAQPYRVRHSLRVRVTTRITRFGLCVLAILPACTRPSVDLSTVLPGRYKCFSEQKFSQRVQMEGASTPTPPENTTIRFEMQVDIDPPDRLGVAHARFRPTRFVQESGRTTLDTERIRTPQPGFEMPVIMVRTTFSARKERGGKWVETGNDLDNVFTEAYSGTPYYEDAKRLVLPMLQQPGIRDFASHSLNPNHCFGGTVKVGDLCEMKTVMEIPVIGSAPVVSASRLEKLKTTPLGDVAEISTLMTFESSTGAPQQFGGGRLILRNVRYSSRSVTDSKIGNAIVSSVQLELDGSSDAQFDAGRKTATGKINFRMTLTGKCESAGL